MITPFEFNNVPSKSNSAILYDLSLLLNGFEDGTFRPNNTITLEEAVKLISEKID